MNNDNIIPLRNGSKIHMNEDPPDEPLRTPDQNEIDLLRAQVHALTEEVTSLSETVNKLLRLLKQERRKK